MKITSFRIVLVYFILSAAYIVLTDKALALVVKDIEELTSLQLYKGLFFVGSTSVLLYFLIKRHTLTLREERAEARLNEDKYRLLFNQNPLPMWVYDISTGAIIDVNQTSLRIYGYTREEFLSMTVEHIQLKQPAAAANILSIGKKQNFFKHTGRWQHIKKDGSVIFVEIFTHSIAYKGKNALIALMNDISEVLKSEKELSTSVNELNNFVYRASHDLRGPIARMAGLAELGKESDDIDTTRNYFTLLGQTALKLDKSLQRLLIINNINGREPEVTQVNLQKTIEDVVGMLCDELTESNIEVSISCDNAPMALADRYLVKVALESIIENSIRYKAPEMLRKATLNISVSIVNHRAEIHISDNGIGIKEEVREYIFGLFYRGTEESKGSGLGLYLATHALGRIDGTISLGPHNDEKTTFIISLPAGPLHA